MESRFEPRLEPRSESRLEPLEPRFGTLVRTQVEPRLKEIMKISQVQRPGFQSPWSVGGRLEPRLNLGSCQIVVLVGFRT